MLQRALKGDHRAAASVFRAAKEFGMLEEVQDERWLEEFLCPELLERLSEASLADFLRVFKELEAEAAEKTRKPSGRRRIDLGAASRAPSSTEPILE
jgi:hypothetical protein